MWNCSQSARRGGNLWRPTHSSLKFFGANKTLQIFEWIRANLSVQPIFPISCVLAFQLQKNSWLRYYSSVKHHHQTRAEPEKCRTSWLPQTAIASNKMVHLPTLYLFPVSFFLVVEGAYKIWITPVSSSCTSGESFYFRPTFQIPQSQKETVTWMLNNWEFKSGAYFLGWISW